VNGSALGQFLRARREQLSPDDVGLAWSGRRRVPGLRREELAFLAGISPDYYLRLEQGRDNTPSVQVVDNLARALRLDPHATAHLHRLAHPSLHARATEGLETVSTSMQDLIACWPTTPAFIHDRYLNVLAANAAASALSPMYSPGINVVKATFMDPDYRKLVRHWDVTARGSVGRLRDLAGPDLDDPVLVKLVDELSVSEEFRRLWERHDVNSFTVRGHWFDHPTVGPLELIVERLTSLNARGQILTVLHAEPGSPSERALTRLAELAAQPDLPGPQ
jgi:transcriptional regulator with XRE-family HTH domain